MCRGRINRTSDVARSVLPVAASVRGQFHPSWTPSACHGWFTPDSCVDQLSPLPDQKIPRPMQHQHALLLDVLDRHKSHRWPRHGLADRRCIGSVILAALYIGFDIGRRHEPRVMPQLPQLASPLMRCCARFHANAARRQLGKELKNSRPTNTHAGYERAATACATPRCWRRRAWGPVCGPSPAPRRRGSRTGAAGPDRRTGIGPAAGGRAGFPAPSGLPCARRAAPP
jgi:hypothetical protein